MILFHKLKIPLLITLLALHGSVISATISVTGSEVTYSDTQPNVSGAVTLSGGDLYPDSDLSDLTPAAGHTAIQGGPICNLPTVPYATNMREASYTLQNGLAKGSTLSGAAYGKVACAGVQAGDTVTLNGVAFTAVSGMPSGNQFLIGGSDAATAANLKAAINASTDVAIAGKAMAAKDLNGDNVVWIEAAAPGTAGNANALSSGNNARLAVTAFAHGTNGAVAAAPFWYLARTIPLSSPLRAGKKVRFRFSVSGADVNPLNGAAAYLTILFSGAGETTHQETFALSEGQVTSQEYAPLADTTVITAGVAVTNYNGSWQLSDFHLLESSPDAYRSSGELTIPINLSRAAGPPSGSATSGIGGRIKRFGFLFGNGEKASNLAGLSAGDVIATGIGDVNGISANESAIITQAKAQGLEIYGYVALGEDDDALNILPYSEAQLTTFFNRAKSLGIAGIYFDIPDNGPPWPGGFGVSRYRQVWAANACHALGLKVLFNSASTVLDNSANEGNANPDEGTQHGINDGTPIPWGPGDGILAESFGLRSDGVVQDWTAFQATGLRMLNAKKDLGIKTYGLFYFLPSRTTLTQDHERRFAFFASALYNLDGYSLYGGPNFTDDYERPSAFLGNSFADPFPIAEAGGNRLSRKTDVGVIEVTRDAAQPNGSDTARDGASYGKQQNITVTQMTAPETLNGGTVAWKIASSPDGSTYSAETTLTDTNGMLTGFPSGLPSYVKLRALLSTPDSTKSPTLTPPFTLSVNYAGAAYARLYGTILPTVSTETVSDVTVTYARQGPNALFVGGIAYAPAKDAVSVKPDSAGTWQVFLPAASTGTTYEITLKAGDQSATHRVTLTAGGETQF
jgi:hypothetical protein